jgi:hypothetical protein
VLEVYNMAKYTIGNKLEWNIDIWRGLIKAGMLALDEKSSEQDVIIARTPVMSVVAKKTFAVGSLQLVGLPPSIVLCKKGSEIHESAVELGVVFSALADSVDVLGAVKPQLVLGKAPIATGCSSKTQGGFLVPGWTLRQSYEDDEANVEIQLKKMTIKLFDVRQVMVHVFVDPK